MSNIKETTAWAVVDQEGIMLTHTISAMRVQSILRYEDSGYRFEKAQKQGYSCIEVTIKPKEKV